jgi:hypothetical protein
MASVVAAQTWPGHHGLSARWTRNVASIPKRVLCLAEAKQRFRPVSLDLGVAWRAEAAWSADRPAALLLALADPRPVALGGVLADEPTWRGR